MSKHLFFESIINSFKRLDKDISHLSYEQVEEKAKIVFDKTRAMGIDVNDGDQYLKVVYEVFDV
jgi:hypothetical protein